MSFSKPQIKQLLTEPIVSRWINAFEELIGLKGHFYPVRNEPISPKAIKFFCDIIRQKIGIKECDAIIVSNSVTVSRREAFSIFVRLFTELKNYMAVPIPLRDMSENDLNYDDVTLLRTLDIIGTVYRSRDVDLNRPLTYFETAKILTRIHHVLTKVTIDCQVFLAHSSKDKDIVRDVWATLQARGISCFIDEVNLHLSDDLQDALANQIANQKTVVVAFLSNNSIDAPWVKFELRVASKEALSDNQKLLLIRLDDVIVPAKFSGLRYSDFLFCRSPKEYERLCDLEKNVEEIYFTLLASKHTVR